MDVSTVGILFNAGPSKTLLILFRDDKCSGLLIDRAEKQFGWWGHLGNSAGLDIDSHKQSRAENGQNGKAMFYADELTGLISAMNMFILAEERRVCS